MNLPRRTPWNGLEADCAKAEVRMEEAIDAVYAIFVEMRGWPLTTEEIALLRQRCLDFCGAVFDRFVEGDASAAAIPF